MRTLVWEELWFRLTDRMSHPFLFEAVSRPSGLLFLGGFPALVALMSWSFFRYARARACHVAFAAWILAVGSVVTLVGSGIAAIATGQEPSIPTAGGLWDGHRVCLALPWPMGIGSAQR